MNALAPAVWEVIEGNYFFSLAEFKALKIHGPDAERFLNGQLTQDITLISADRGAYSARLNGKGQLVSWQLLFKQGDSYLAFVPHELADSFKSDLEKFIIMDDVEIEFDPTSFDLVFGAGALSYPDAPFIIFLGLPARLVTSSARASEAMPIARAHEHLLEVLSAYPIWEKTLMPEVLVNETIFEQIGVSYSKGCFLGQETAAKIHHRRGASYAPSLLWGREELPLGTFETMGRKGGVITAKFKHEDWWIHLCQLFREFRLEGLILEIGTQNYEVATHKGLLTETAKSWAQRLYERGTELFSGDQEESALTLLKLCLELDATHADAYEVVGVILGRHQRFEEAITYMDHLSAVDPHSVMAHTNKSLYLMKLGHIEAAEAEKSKATLKTFEKLGREAQQKRDLEAQKKAQQAEQEKRRGMFLQVLEIDPDDEIALYGLGDLAFADQKYDVALEYFERVLKANPKNSRAYLMAAKTYEALNQKDEARSLYERGITVATKAGELMPASEMRSRLVALT